MEINGLPLHPLAVHGAVVLTPLAALLCLAYVLPAWRDRLRWPVAIGVLVALGAVWAAYLSGTDFYDGDRFTQVGGELKGKIDDHADLGNQLRWVATGWAVVALAAVGLHERAGVVRGLLAVLLVVGSLATIVLTIMTGDAGAQAVWGK